MNDDSDNALSLQPIRLMQLFPVRKISCLEFDLQKYRKLHEMLNCSFCRKIFNNPTYLRCSHRFCKECIEKHIRKNDKKSCPICRGQLTTKRDTKSDFMLNCLINYAFGDSTALQEQINKCQESAVKKLKFTKTKGGIQMQYKRERTQSQDIKSKAYEPPPKKRAKKDPNQEYTEEKGQQKKVISQEDSKKKQQANHVAGGKPPKQTAGFIILDKDLQVTPTKTRQQKKQTIIITKSQPSWCNTKSKNSIKNHQVIQIHSQNSNQQQKQIKKSVQNIENIQKIQQLYQLQDQLITKNSLQKSLQPPTQFISLTKAPTQHNKNDQILQKQKNISIQSHKQKQKQVESKIKDKKKTQSQFFQLYQYDHQILQARKKIKQAFGPNYMKALIKKSSKLSYPYKSTYTCISCTICKNHYKHVCKQYKKFYSLQIKFTKLFKQSEYY